MMTGKCYFNALHSKPEMVTTLLMQSDSFTTKQVLLNITFRNYTVSKLQLPELMPFILNVQPPQQTPMMEEACTQLFFFFATHARIMLTANIWQQVGLCNGAAGTVHQLLYQLITNHHTCPLLYWLTLTTLLIHPFLSSRPNCVPVPPLTFEWESNDRQLPRQQLPLQFRYAITIHKSQGQTFDKAVSDIGKAELAAGCTFATLSFLRSLNHGLIQPMSFQRLQVISTGKRPIERLDEGRRLKPTQFNSTPTNKPQTL